MSLFNKNSKKKEEPNEMNANAANESVKKEETNSGINPLRQTDIRNEQSDADSVGVAPDLQNKTSEKVDNQQADVADLAFKHFLYMEAAYRHQEITPRGHIVVPRSTGEKAVTFYDVLKAIYPETADKYTGKAFVSKRDGDSLSALCDLNAQQFLQQSPFMFLFHRNADGMSSVVDESVNLSLEYKADNGEFYFTTLVIKPIGSTVNSVYARVTVMNPSEAEEDLVTAQSRCLPLSTSFIMIYDVTDPQSDLQRYEAIEKSAMEKVNQQQVLEPYEDEVMRGMGGINYPAYNMGFGKWLFDHQRYYDAFVTFQRVYNCLKHEMYHLEKEAQAMFYHACYGMGLCMQHLGFLDKAAYYLQLAINGGEDFIGAYVEVLALGAHNRVCYFLNQLRAQAPQSKPAANELKRLEKVAADAEKQYHVAETFDMSTLPLGYVLQQLFDATPDTVLGATVCSTSVPEAKGKILSSKDEIWTLNLYEETDKILYVRYSRCGAEMGVDYDSSIMCQNNCVVLNVKRVTTPQGQPYARVNVMVPNFPQNDEKRFPVPFNWPNGASFVIGCEPEAATLGKQDLQTIFETGVKLMQSFRVLEAMRAFQYVHDALKIEYTKVSASDEDEELFFDATYELGSCMVALGLYERATYYLDWAQEGYKVDYAREYANCLCANDDVRAMDVVNNLLTTMKRPKEEQYQQAYEHFMAYMKRRKVFLLCQRQMFKEAEELLNEMLLHPLTKDYAEHELANLKKAQ